MIARIIAARGAGTLLAELGAVGLFALAVLLV